MINEEIIQQILRQHPEIAREVVLERLRVEKNKAGGLIEEATLLRLIAAEYGVKILAGTVYDRELSIRHLVPDLNDVAVSGRVVAVYPVRTFEGKKSGKYASVMIADKDRVLRVMLWNDKADLVGSGELKVGLVVRFSHGYTREDRYGKVELHVGEKSRVEVDSRDLQAEDYPSISKFATKISDVTSARRVIHVVGVVQAVYPSSVFTRRDLSVGKVLRFMLADGSGEVVVVVWDEKVDELEPHLKRGVAVQLVNAKAKAASNGGFEIHVNSSTYVGVSAVVE
jgi:ssDNA-binding replication factor A large subunit